MGAQAAEPLTAHTRVVAQGAGRPETGPCEQQEGTLGRERCAESVAESLVGMSGLQVATSVRLATGRPTRRTYAACVSVAGPDATALGSTRAGSSLRTQNPATHTVRRAPRPREAAARGESAAATAILYIQHANLCANCVVRRGFCG
jgi:hypothetical protein